jgi:hypothetical protein
MLVSVRYYAKLCKIMQKTILTDCRMKLYNTYMFLATKKFHENRLTSSHNLFYYNVLMSECKLDI